jgi:Tn3 transposase DDE domain
MDGRLWLDARAKALGHKLDGVARAIDQGQLSTSAIHGGQLHVDRLEKTVPDGAEDLVLALYRDMPQTRITDLLLEVDDRIEFTSAFTNPRTGIPCRDRVGVLSVLLGLKKMAEACDTHSFWELLRVGRWFVREDTTAQALSMVVEAQGTLPMAKFWGWRHLFVRWPALHRGRHG